MLLLVCIYIQLSIHLDYALLLMWNISTPLVLSTHQECPPWRTDISLFSFSPNSSPSLPHLQCVILTDCDLELQKTVDRFCHSHTPPIMVYSYCVISFSLLDLHTYVHGILRHILKKNCAPSFKKFVPQNCATIHLQV